MVNVDFPRRKKRGKRCQADGFLGEQCVCHTLELCTSATHQDRWVCTQKYNTEDLKGTSRFRDVREKGLAWHVGAGLLLGSVSRFWPPTLSGWGMERRHLRWEHLSHLHLSVGTMRGWERRGIGWSCQRRLDGRKPGKECLSWAGWAIANLSSFIVPDVGTACYR